jgi:hypothetical protein
MPIQYQDRLLPGEELAVGECLISNSGRFRLYLLDGGELRANAYSAPRRGYSGVFTYWSSRPVPDAGWTTDIGPRPVLKLTSFAPRPGTYSYPRLAVFNTTGKPVWGSGYRTSHREPEWKALYFQLQDDANLVLYIVNERTGEVVDSWAPDRPPVPIDALANPDRVAPNTRVCDFSGLGTLAIDGGTDDFVNNWGNQVLVRDEFRIEALPDGKSLPISLPGPGALAISSTFVWIDDPSGRTPYRPNTPISTGNSADAGVDYTIHVPPRESRDHRRFITLLPTGQLALTG